MARIHVVHIMAPKPGKEVAGLTDVVGARRSAT